MEAFHSWIAPILTRALDEHLDAADSKSLHIEDDLSNLYIHCDSTEFVQLVEWQSAAADLTATVADSETSIRAVFAQVSSSQWAQTFTAFSLLDLKPGAVFRLNQPEIRISDCFDPVRVEIRVTDFSLLHNGGDHQPRKQLVDISTLPAVTDRLGRFIRHRVGDTMARLASNSAVGGSPGLKSQKSAEEDSDVENSGDPFGSQSNFATQLPFSPPKPLETGSLQKPQLLGNRKVMGNLRQLGNVKSRVPKKTKTCIDDKRLMNVESRNVQTEVEQGEVMAVTATSASKSNGLPMGPDVRSSMSGLGGPSEQGVVKLDLDPVEDGRIRCQNPHVYPTSRAISESRVHHSDDRLDTLARWRDRLSKPAYLPRYLQTISKAQNDLLASDDSWQPALVGRPSRPGTLPLELLNSLTAAADQKNVIMNKPVQSNQQGLGILLAISRGEACVVDKEPDLTSNSAIRKLVDQTHNQSPGGVQETKSESDESSVEWSLSPPQPSPPPPRLPPDSSPVQVPPKRSVPSPSDEGALRLKSETRELAPLSPLQQPPVRDVEESSQAPRDNSNRTDSIFTADLRNMKTSSTLHEKPTFASLNTTAAVPNSLGKGDQALASKSEFPSLKIPTNQSAQTPIIESSDPTTDLKVNINNVIQVSHTSFTPWPPTSSTPQPNLRQIKKHSLNISQRQPASQQLPPHSSTQLIPGTLPLESVRSRLTGSLHDLHQPKESMEDFEIDSSEDGSMHSADSAKPSSDNQHKDEQPDEFQQGTLMIQRALQAIPVTRENPKNADDGTTAQSIRAHTGIGAISEERCLAALDSKAVLKRQANNMDHDELSRHSKRAKPILASSVLSVSSEEPDFRRVDNMTRQYRRKIFNTFRRNESAPPLQPSTILASDVSPQSESVQSSNKRRSAQSWAVQQITSSTPLTSVSGQAQKVLREGPVPTSDTSRRSLLQPEDQFLVFKQTYPTYEGSITQFLRSCSMIKKIRVAGKMLPQGVWDDFVYRHHHDYRSHLRKIAQSDELESPLPYEEYYADYVPEPVHLKRVLRFAFIDALSVEEPLVAFDLPPARPPSQSDRLENHRYSVAASNSASNIRPKESLADRPDRVVRKNVSMTLESQLQLKEQEEALQSQSSSVHLWLQKASGAASPELGTPDRLATQGGIPRIDLAENDDSSTFDLASEKLPVTALPTNTRKSASGVSVANVRSPDIITEPFKHSALNHAKHDVGQHGRSWVRTDAKGALRPEVQRIVDIFKWRARDSRV